MNSLLISLSLLNSLSLSLLNSLDPFFWFSQPCLVFASSCSTYYAVIEDKVIPVQTEWSPGMPIFNGVVGQNEVIAQFHERDYKGMKVQFIGSKVSINTLPLPLSFL